MSPVTQKLARLALLLALLPAALEAQLRLPGPTPVGTPAATQPVTLTITQTGQLDSVHVITQGSEHFDFTDAGRGSCWPGNSYLPGQTCTVNLAFTPLAPGERRGAVVLLNRAGTPMGMQLLTAQANGSVATFVPGTITTVAGDQAWIYSGDGGPATQSSIFLPFGLAVDAAGNLYIADTSNNRIRKVDALTGLISTLAGTGTIGSTGDNGPALSATLSNPSSIALDPAGNLYFADSGNNVIRRIDAFTGTITTVAGQINTHGYTGDAGPATLATLTSPNGLAFDAAGNLYIADTGNHVVRFLTAATGIISTIAGRGAPAYTGDGGPATAAALNGPWSVTLSTAGELYIADQNNHAIRKITAAGIISTVAGTGGAGFSGDQGPAAFAQLNVPASIAIDPAGSLYIADSGNNRVRKVSGKTGVISTIAGTSGESISGDAGPADQASLYGPYTLALDGQDNLFIADVFHNRIRKVAATTATLMYPAIRVGRISAPIKQTIENDGNAPLTWTGMQAVSNSQLDAASTTCSPGLLLQPMDTCITAVDFAPTTTGNPVLGSFTLLSDAGNSPSTLLLTGQVLDIDPTTLTLTSSANPALTGNPITFSAAATSAGTTPTGPVTFYDGNSPMGTVQLAVGAAAYTTSALTAGQHSITASYAGDTSNAAQISTALIETVKDAQAPTYTVLTASANPVDAGATLTLNAGVQLKTAGSGTAPMAGAVTFTEGTTTLGTVSIDTTYSTSDRGTATFGITNLPVGTHSIVAAYAGNINDTPSTSAAISITVHLATTKLALATTANPGIAGTPLALSATILSTGGTPTGPVVFFDGSTSLGTANLNGQGIATLQVPTWLPGTHTLTATYAGDSADSASASPALTETINLATTSTALASSLNPSGVGAPITLTASVSGNGGSPSGSVQFFDGTVVLGQAPLTAGTANLSIATLTLGTHTLTAVYAGDPSDSSSTSPAIPQQVQPAVYAVTLATSKNPAIFGDAISLSTTITSTGATPSGTATFFDGPNAIGTVTLDPAGKATLTLSTLPIGVHTITVQSNGVTSAAITQSVLQTTATTLAPSVSRATAGLPVQVNINVAGTNSKATTGIVTLTDGSITLATLVPDATGNATYTAQLAPGQHTLQAAFAGDPNDQASTSAPAPLLVEIASTTTTVTTSANPAAASSPLTLTATVSGTGATPTGNLTFLDGTTVLATAPVAANGTTTLTLATLAPGIHHLTAAYAGDPNDAPSNSPSLAEQIALQTTLALAASANPALLSDNVTLTITAANGSTVPPIGQVTITDGTTPLTTLTLLNGVATYTFSAPSLGTHPLTATYAGDPQNGPATAKPLIETVTLRPSTTALTTSSTALAAGQQLILISVVQIPPGQGAGPHAPTGTVTFSSGPTVLGTATVSPAGVATLTLNPLQSAIILTAQYSGEPLYAPSTSTAINITVGPPVSFNITTNPTSLSLQSGQHSTIGIAIASAPTFKDTLAMGCAGLPASATCTFSASQLAVTPGAPQSLTVTIDTGNPLGVGSAAGIAFVPFGTFLAWLLGRRRVRLGSRVALAAVALVAALTITTGCASTFSQTNTPAGDYTFQIVATGNSTAATQSATIHLTVTK